jgi:transposase InsO family protein
MPSGMSAALRPSWAVGYAIARSIDASLTIAALKAAIDRRRQTPGCVHHSDRGSQYAGAALP